MNKEFLCAEVAGYRAILDALPSPIFIVDGNVKIVEANSAAKERYVRSGKLAQSNLCGHILECFYAVEQPCGEHEKCPECVVRSSVNSVRENGTGVRRKLGRMRLKDDPFGRGAWFLITVQPLPAALADHFLLVLDDVTEVMMLREIIPMCANCHKVRNDLNYWETVEAYLAHHARISVTHGICPECTTKLYPGLSFEDAAGQPGAPRQDP